MMKLLGSLLCLIVGLAFSSASSAQTTLIGWDVAGTSESASTLTFTTIATNISTTSPSGVLSRGSGAALPGSPASNSFGASGFNSSSLENAISANDYFTFSVTVNSGFQMTLSSVAFKMSETTSGPTNAALFSSVGGFSSSNAISSWALPSASNSDQSITLSGGSFANLTGTVEFRIYAWGGGSSTTDKFRFRNLTGDDLVISGTTSAIPEPSTYAAIVGVLALGGVMWQRRRKAKQAS